MGLAAERAALVAQLGLAIDPTGLSLKELESILKRSAEESPLTPWGPLDGYLAANSLASGEETVPRSLLGSPTTLSTTQALRLTGFTARKTETITQVKMITGGTAAGATPSLIRIGIYTVAANGDITLVASTPTDTTLFAAANTAYTKALSAAFAKVAGQRYAVGLLLNTAAAFPSIVSAGGGNTAIDKFALTAPMLTAQVTGQADLPASVANASVIASGIGPLYCELLP